PSAANIDAYADIVRNRSVARQLVMLGRSLSADAMSPRSDIFYNNKGIQSDALFCVCYFSLFVRDCMLVIASEH
ncbi:hypothetical protein, partial [Pectobacterium carotovorum]|uniref:hypothetical protein n=1 Tax=Pectobacterium carotovorum TaxID=554 RepID=UPI001BE4CCDF